MTIPDHIAEHIKQYSKMRREMDADDNLQSSAFYDKISIHRNAVVAEYMPLMEVLVDAGLFDAYTSATGEGRKIESVCENGGFQLNAEDEASYQDLTPGLRPDSTIQAAKIQSHIERLAELNESACENGGAICEKCQAEMESHRAAISEQFLPTLEILAETGVLSVMIPDGDDEDSECEFRQIEGAFTCEHGGGLHLVAEGPVEDEAHEHSNLLN